MGDFGADPDPLELLAEMSRDFSESTDTADALAKGLARIAGAMGAEGGALFLSEDTAQVCRASFGPVDITGLSVPHGAGIVGRSVSDNTPVMVRDVSSDPDFHGDVDEQSGFTTRSILCAPLRVRDDVLGAIEVVNKIGGDGLFSDQDLNLLSSLAVSAGLAIMNARQAEALVEQEKLKRELALAAEIQRSLLPPPCEDGYPVCGVNRAARVVSGDFYDFLELDDGRIAFTLADVSGKGMNAALLMSKTAALFRALAKQDADPARLLKQINAEIVETSTRGMFVTMVVGVYDPQSGDVLLGNAGHEPPLVDEGADVGFRAIGASAPPVGILPDLDVACERFNLLGRALYIFTDGVTEGYGADGTELGTQGFQDCMRAWADRSARQRIETLADEMTGTGHALRDDLTVLVVDDGTGAEGRIYNKDTGAENPSVKDRNLIALDMPAEASSLKVVRHALSDVFSGLGFDEGARHDVTLALDEALQNVIRHAYGEASGRMRVAVLDLGDAVAIEIEDDAPFVDEALIQPRQLDDIRPGGLGVHFISEIMDGVERLPMATGQGNLLRLIKKKPELEG